MLGALLLLMMMIPPPAAQANTVIVVNTTADSTTADCSGGQCSLRGAIIKANTTPNTPVTIQLPAGIYTLTLAGRLEWNAQTGDLDIRNTNITIIGSNGDANGNPEATIIQAGTSAATGIDRVFTINPDLDPSKAYHATFKALTIQHGRNEDPFAELWGGGIFWDAGAGGTFTMDNVIVRNNMTTRSHGGGLLLSNLSETGGQITITRTTITGNETNNGSGGGIWINGEIPTTISDSVISNNRSIHGGLRGGSGGGLYTEDSGTVVSPTPVTITRTVISGNEARESQGGGIFTARPLHLTHSTVSGNFAKQQGGGIWANYHLANTVTMANVTISGNTSEGYGGGYYQTLAATGQVATLTNVTIANNRAFSTGSFLDPNAEGGGIYLNQANGAGTMVLRNSIVAGNLRGTGTTASDARGTGAFHAANSTHNLLGTGGSGGLVHGTNNNLVGIADPRLGALQHNGGATVGALSSSAGIRLNPLTHALLPGSPALDAGNNTYASSLGLTTDQRGTNFHRLSDAADANTTKTVDMGAYEAHPMIEDITDKSMLQDTTLEFEFYWGDTERGANTPTVTSSNTTVLPNSGITLSAGSSANAYRLRFEPAAGQYGTTVVTVTKTAVIDGTTITKTDTFVLTVRPRPDLTVTKSHTGNFRQGQTGATYTIQVSNLGPGNTEGTEVTLTDTLPSGLTATAIGGTGWNCTLGTMTCTRSDTLSAGAAYPSITLTVNVALDAAVGAPGNILTNAAAVSGGLDNTPGNNSAADPTYIVQVADMVITKSHTGDFRQGQTGATYTLTVSNQGYGPTDAPVTVTDTLPAGLTATAMSGTGWSCTLGTLSCTRSDALAKDGSYPPITLTVDVSPTAGASLTNVAAVSGGGEAVTNNNTASDPTTVIQVADMTVTKSHTGNFRQGQTGAVYTIVVRNSGYGPTDALVTLTDTLPAGLTATEISGDGWDCTLETLTCTRSDVLAVNTDYPAITLTVDVAANAAASITNTAVVSGGGEAIISNNTANDPTTVDQVADLTVSKSHTGDFTQGQTGATYTITVSNVGPGPTLGTVTVTDTLPGGLTATDLSGTGWNCTLETLTCTRSDALASGASYPVITLTVNVATGAPPTLTNEVAVSGGGELNTGNNTASDETTIIQLPDLTITKSHTGDFAQGQSGAQYTITVTNSGSGLTSGTVTVTDTLPAGLTATALSGTGWSCTLGTLTCTRSDALGAGASYPAITLTVDVSTSAPASVTNTASVTGGGDVDPSNNTASDPTTILSAPDLTITKSHTGDFRQGQVGAVYTLRVRNSGAQDTVGEVTVTDTLPTGMTATAISGDGWTCELATLTCTRSDVLAPSASYPDITLVGDVAVDAPTSLTNTASVSGGGELNTANNSASDPTTVNQLSDLTVAKAHTGTFTQGQTGSFTITVSNVGPGPTEGTVTVTDTLPASLTATAISGTGWSCTLGTLTCTRSDVLASGASYPVITLTVDVAANAPPSVTNEVAVSGGGELNTANNSASSTATVVQLPDLRLTKAAVGEFRQGAQGEYTLTVTNHGTGLTDGTVSVSDTLPAGLTPVSLQGTGWNCTLATLTCTRSDELAAGDSYPVITLVVQIAADAAASLTNEAVVSGGGDVDSSNNTASTATAITQMPNLTVVQAASEPFHQGQADATYTITVQNVGSAPTIGTVTLTETLPASLTVVSLAGDGWTCDPGTVSCTRSDALAAGSAYPAITLTVQVAAGAPSSVTSTAAVSGGGDITAANNTAALTTTVLGAPDLRLTKTAAGTFTQGQQNAAFTLTVENIGTGPTYKPVTLTDTLPAGLTAVSLSGTGWTCTLASLSCERSDELAAGASYPAITLTVRVADDAPASLTNTAAVTGGGDLTPANNTAQAEATITQLPDLTIAKSHRANFLKGQRDAEFTLTVTNVGRGATTGLVTVTDVLPADAFEAVSISGTGWTCTLASLECTRSDALAAGASYPVITLVVNVKGTAPAEATNVATVAGGGQIILTNDQASDLTRIVPPVEPPWVRITPPVRETREASILISGNGKASATVVVNGIPVQSSPIGTWSVTVPLEEGPNQITATLEGQSDSVTVIRKTTPPQLTFVASVSVTNQSTVDLAAGSKDPDVTISIMGQAVSRLTVPLAMGQNTFTARAVDPLGNEATASVTVLRVTAPVLDTVPAVVSRAELTVTGRAVAGTEVTLLVGGAARGTATADAEGRFSLDVQLTEGVNRIAAKGAGDLLSGEAQVVYRKAIPLVDVPGHWAARSIERMVERGVVRGYDDNTFRPEAQVSRIEFAVMMARLLELEPGGGSLSFTDSGSIPAWGADQVAAAVKAGIITGRANGSFDPNAPVTRAEVAIMLTRAMRYAGLPVGNGNASFADSGEIPAWALEQVRAAAEAGLVTGYQDGTFRPGNTATRAEAVTMMTRLLNLLLNR